MGVLSSLHVHTRVRCDEDEEPAREQPQPRVPDRDAHQPGEAGERQGLPRHHHHVGGFSLAAQVRAPSLCAGCSARACPPVEGPPCHRALGGGLSSAIVKGRWSQLLQPRLGASSGMHLLPLDPGVVPGVARSCHLAEWVGLVQPDAHRHWEPGARVCRALACRGEGSSVLVPRGGAQDSCGRPAWTRCTCLGMLCSR